MNSLQPTRHRPDQEAVVQAPDWKPLHADEQAQRGEVLLRLCKELDSLRAQSASPENHPGFLELIDHAYPPQDMRYSSKPSRIDAAEYLQERIGSMSASERRVMFERVSANILARVEPLASSETRNMPQVLVDDAIGLAFLSLSDEGNQFLTDLAALPLLPDLFYAQAAQSIRRYVDEPPSRLVVQIMRNPPEEKVITRLFATAHTAIDVLWSSQNEPEASRLELLENLCEAARTLWKTLEKQKAGS